MRPLDNFNVRLIIFALLWVLNILTVNTIKSNESVNSKPERINGNTSKHDKLLKKVIMSKVNTIIVVQNDNPKGDSTKNFDTVGSLTRDVLAFNKNMSTVPISIYQQTIAEDIQFDPTIFDSTFHVIRSQMDGQMYFDKVQFNGPSLFLKNIFKDTVYFIGIKAKEFFTIDSSTFKEVSLFDNCEFFDTTLIQNSEFKELYLRNSIFGLLSSFQGNTFLGYADFVRSKFLGNVHFTGSKFTTTCDFFFSEFKGKADFSFCEFGSKLILEGAIISQGLYFYNATLPDTLDLSNISKSMGVIDLMNVLPPRTGSFCYVNLLNTDLENLKLTYDRFRLYFPKKQNSLSSPSDSNSSLTTFEQKNGIYTTLLNKFTMDGLSESYRELDLEHKKFLSENTGIFGKVIYYLQYYWWQFGYKKHYVIFWMLGFITLFTLIVYFFFEYFTRKTYSTKFITDYQTRRINEHKRFKKLQASLAYCLVLFFGYKIELDRIRDINIGLYVVFIFYFLGLLCNVFLINWIFSN